MLEGLENIDWSSLGHAYGSAEDLPGLIRNLTSPDGAIRHKARSELFNNIHHQGSISQATGYAIPFLLELLKEPSVRDKDRLLQSLAFIAEDSAAPDIDQYLPLYKENLDWLQKAYLNVEIGFPIYVNLLDDPDPLVRAAAAGLLAQLRTYSATTATTLLAHISQEASPQAKAGMLLSLGDILEPNREVLSLYENLLNSNEHALVRLAAAMALTRLSGENAPTIAIQMLVESLSDSSLARLYFGIPGRGNLVADICRLLGSLHPNQVQFALPILLEIFKGIKLPEEGGHPELIYVLLAVYVAQTLLHIVFDGRSINPNIIVRNLTQDQQTVLNALAESRATWVFIDMAGVMRQFGLPTDQKALQQFLELDMNR